jgi:hypothetical protein
MARITPLLAPPGQGAEALMPTVRGDMSQTLTYMLFRRPEEPDLVFAIPEHSPVPPFLLTADWRFSGRIRMRAASPAP